MTSILVDSKDKATKKGVKNRKSNISLNGAKHNDCKMFEPRENKNSQEKIIQVEFTKKDEHHMKVKKKVPLQIIEITQVRDGVRLITP